MRSISVVLIKDMYKFWYDLVPLHTYILRSSYKLFWKEKRIFIGLSNATLSWGTSFKHFNLVCVDIVQTVRFIFSLTLVTSVRCSTKAPRLTSTMEVFRDFSSRLFSTLEDSFLELPLYPRLCNSLGSTEQRLCVVYSSRAVNSLATVDWVEERYSDQSGPRFYCLSCKANLLFLWRILPLLCKSSLRSISLISSVQLQISRLDCLWWNI